MKDPILQLILSAFAFAFGSVIASFLNVVIWRVPRGESIVTPPSHCPKCSSVIRWYQNIPILSWLALRGRCAKCRAPISPRYVLVETLGGLLFLAVFRLFAVPPLGLATVVDILTLWAWISLMIVGSFIDYDHKLLPDFTTVGGMALGLLYGAISSWLASDWLPLAHSAIGLAFGFGLFWLVRWLGSKAFHREAMGMGDVFLMGAVGAMTGPVSVLFVLFVSSLVGSVCGLTLVALKKTRLGGLSEIPYGPYICLAETLFILYGPQVIAWYLALLGFSAQG